MLKHFGCKKIDCNGASALLGINNLRNYFEMKNLNTCYLVFFNGDLEFQEQQAGNSELSNSEILAGPSGNSEPLLLLLQMLKSRSKVFKKDVLQLFNKK